MDPREERGILGHGRVDEAGIVEVRGQVAPRGAAVDRQARHAPVFGRGPDHGADRLPEVGRGNAVGLDAAAVERDGAGHRLESAVEPGDVDPVAVERQRPLDGGGRVSGAERQREHEVDRAVAVDRDVLDQIGEPRP